MTNKEIVSLMAMATANYPHLQDKDMTPTLSLWKEMMSDMPFDVAKTALIKVLSTAKFFPTVAEIREAALFVTGQTAMTGAEAWELFEKADERFGYYKAVEAMQSLPPTIQQTVRAMGGFRSVSASENTGVTRGQFIKMFEQLSARDNELNKIPTNVRQLIDKSTNLLPEVGQ